jgi:hypothetical protein
MASNKGATERSAPTTADKTGGGGGAAAAAAPSVRVTALELGAASLVREFPALRKRVSNVKRRTAFVRRHLKSADEAKKSALKLGGGDSCRSAGAGAGGEERRPTLVDPDPPYTGAPVSIPGLSYYPNFFSAAEQSALLGVIDSNPWKSFIAKRQQFYGEIYYHTSYKSKDAQPESSEMVGLDLHLMDRLKEKCVHFFEPLKWPSQVLVNE